MTETEIPQFAHGLRLDGKGFVVLGAGQGIGEQACHALAQSGAKVLCVDVDESRARSMAAAVAGIACVADVMSRSDMTAVFETARREFGGRIDGIVDVVGMPVARPLSSHDDDSWNRQFDLVVRHAFLAIQLAEPLLAPGASVVLVGSMGGVLARGGPALAYSAAKAALHQMARSAAQEFADRGIRVNVVAPGLTRTPRLVQANDAAFWERQCEEIPLGRAGSTSDIANAILFLSSPMAAYVTGVLLPVDGGMGLGKVRVLARSGLER